MLESVPKSGRGSAILVFRICQNSLLWNQDRTVLQSLTVLPSSMIFKHGWPVLLPPPHTRKLISPSGLWCRHLGLDTSIPAVYETRALAAFFLGLTVWSPLPLTETRKLTEHASVCSGIGLPTQQGAHSFILFAPTAKKISFHCSFWVLLP